MASDGYHQWLMAAQLALQDQHLIRQHYPIQSPQGSDVVCANQTLINFSSNDYLSLASDPQLIQALAEGAQRFGVGSGASHLISGHHEVHDRLCQSIAQWTGREAALLFSSGYMANMALMTTLVEKDDIIIQDRLNHASLIDGARMSQAQHKRYQHLDMDSLEQQLKTQARFKWIVTDGVFSMDGDIAPVTDIMMLAQHYDAQVMIDDAHGLGVLGPTGAGTLEYSFERASLNDQPVDVLMGTLGKALGTGGAFIAAEQVIVDHLIQRARPYIYTTALSPALAYATIKSIELVKIASKEQKLSQLIHDFQNLAKQYALPIVSSVTAIQPLILQSSSLCMALAEYLRQEGFWVGAIRYPTVPKNQARLRITLNVKHTYEQMKALLASIHHWLQQHHPEYLTDAMNC